MYITKNQLQLLYSTDLNRVFFGLFLTDLKERPQQRTVIAGKSVNAKRSSQALN
jgi:hypothetical protein